MISPLDTDDLFKRVDDINQISLRSHHRIDILVSGRCLVNNIFVFPALNTFRRLCVILESELFLRLPSGHCSPGAMATTVETVRITLAPDDVAARPHRARDDP